ncbi:MAG: hypothetical protein RL266_2731 [Bacteroidota bacterium]|jgi:glycosyltransferase involved in cell wall biosynthesis
MRIALIHYRLLKNGGLETRLFNYLSEFRKLGHELTLVVSKIDPDVEIDPSIQVQQVNLKRVPKPLRMYFFDRALNDIVGKRNFDLSFSLGRTSHQDLVLCPGNHLGYLKATNKRIWSPIDLLNIYMDRIAYRKSKLILAASEMMKDELVQLYQVPEEKLKVLLPPIDTTRFNSSEKTDKAKFRKKYGFSSDKKSLLFLTTGNERKGYPFLLRLMNELVDNPVELIVAGVKPIPSSLQNVKYIGYTDKPEELLWAADALVHPALYEPFGQVITEAIQCGTPVLVSKMVGAKQIVNGSVGEVVSDLSTDAWKDAILRVTQTEWNMPTDFAENNDLTVQQHCQKILEYAEQIK